MISCMVIIAHLELFSPCCCAAAPVAGSHFDPQVVDVFLQLLNEERPAIETIEGD